MVCFILYYSLGYKSRSRVYRQRYGHFYGSIYVVPCCNPKGLNLLKMPYDINTLKFLSKIKKQNRGNFKHLYLKLKIMTVPKKKGVWIDGLTDY